MLAVQFGDETNVNRFHLEVNALATANVTMFQIDHDTKDVLDAASAPGNQQALGANGGGHLSRPRHDARRRCASARR